MKKTKEKLIIRKLIELCKCKQSFFVALVNIEKSIQLHGRLFKDTSSNAQINFQSAMQEIVQKFMNIK